jgi:hypothetical protein
MTDVQSFPFLHKLLIMDLREVDRDRMISFLREITTELEKAQVCDVRNRIEHRRLDFPNKAEIERACRAIEETVSKMEAAGICPLIYLYAGMTIDLYRRRFVKLRDYRGREIEIVAPSQYEACNLPSALQPQIVVPWMHIGDSLELLRFRFEETSDYVEMWRDYPKTITRIPSDELDRDFGFEQRQEEHQTH